MHITYFNFNLKFKTSTPESLEILKSFKGSQRETNQNNKSSNRSLIHENNSNDILLKNDFSRTKSLSDEQIQLKNNSSHKRMSSSNASVNSEMINNDSITNNNNDNLSSTSTLLSLFPASSLPKLNQMFNSNSNNSSTNTNKLCSRFPCSTSLIDLIILIFRYKDICEKLIELFIPNLINDQNNRIFQIKFNCLNNIYQVSFDFYYL